MRKHMRILVIGAIGLMLALAGCVPLFQGDITMLLTPVPYDSAGRPMAITAGLRGGSETGMVIDVDASADDVWTALRSFNLPFQSDAAVMVQGRGIGATRTVIMNGVEVVDRLDKIDDTNRTLTFSGIGGNIPVANYGGTVSVTDLGDGRSQVKWSSNFDADGVTIDEATTVVSAATTAQALSLSAFARDGRLAATAAEIRAAEAVALANGDTVVTPEASPVMVDMPMSGPVQLFAMLHADAGEPGVYEFPGADGPVVVDGAPVSPGFLVLDGAGEAMSHTAGNDMNSVTVSDQMMADGQVVVGSITSDAPGWIVMHASVDGKPGPVVGSAGVQAGVNENVAVAIDMDALNTVLAEYPPVPVMTDGTATTETPAVTTETPAVTTETPAVTTETPAVTTETPAVTTETPAVTTETPAVTTETPAVTTETPAVTTETPAVTTETPAVTTETPAVTTETPAVTTETPAVTTETPAVTTETPASAGTTAEVNVKSLRVRVGPGTDFGVSGAVSLGELYPVTASDPNGEWVEVQVPAVRYGTGWVFVEYVNLSGDGTMVAVPKALGTAVVNTQGGRLRVRSASGLDAPIIGYVFDGRVFKIIGISDDGNWLQVEVPGLSGESWISSDWVIKK